MPSITAKLRTPKARAALIVAAVGRPGMRHLHRDRMDQRVAGINPTDHRLHDHLVGSHDRCPARGIRRHKPRSIRRVLGIFLSRRR